MRAMQRAVFDIPDPFLNPRVNCDALPGVDLDLWKERVTCKGGRRVEIQYSPIRLMDHRIMVQFGYWLRF